MRGGAGGGLGGENPEPRKRENLENEMSETQKMSFGVQKHVFYAFSKKYKTFRIFC